MRSVLFAICLLGLASLARIADADEQRDRKEQSAKTNALIEKLALSDLPATASREAKDARNHEMKKAWCELRDLGVEAFPEVIEHVEDKRKSFTADSGSTDETWTVGRACHDVLRCNLEPYNKYAMYSSSIPSREVWWRPTYCSRFLKDPKSGKEWLAAHQGKSLLDLQVEVLGWVTTNRSPRKVEINAEDHQRLVDLLTKLKKTREPLELPYAWAI